MRRFSLTCLLSVALLLPGAAQALTDSEALIEKSRITFESLIVDKTISPLADHMKHARGVLIFPNLVKGGFIVGGEGGYGVLLAKNRDGTWSSPAIITLIAASIGLQLGGQSSEVVFIVQTERGLDSLLRAETKLGADASLAVGTIGAGVQGATGIHLAADIIAFERTAGLYGGATFEGAWLRPADSWNREFYGKPATPRDIVRGSEYSNRIADPLRAALARHN
jgi:SH3 domain-containing YSC84-like protein 1